MSGAEEDKKPAGDQAGHINLKVKGQVFFFSVISSFLSSPSYELIRVCFGTLFELLNYIWTLNSFFMSLNIA